MTKKQIARAWRKQYRLTGAKGTPCIAKGNTWAESEVDTAWDVPCPETLEEWDALGLTIQELAELRDVVRMKLEKGRHHPPHWDRHELHRSLATKLDDLLAEVNHESKL